MKAAHVKEFGSGVWPRLFWAEGIANLGVSMLTGKRFRLERATLSIEITNTRPTAFTVPAGSIVKVLSGPSDGDGLVNVAYEGRKLQMFAVDVSGRGTEVADSGAGAH